MWKNKKNICSICEKEEEKIYTEREVLNLLEDCWNTSSVDRLSEAETIIHFIKWYKENKKK